MVAILLYIHTLHVTVLYSSFFSENVNVKC